MYNIELKHITLENAQNEILKATENICSTFQLEEQFGVISYGLHELVSLIERCSDNQDATFSVNFYIEAEKISVQITDCAVLSDVSAMITRATLEDAETEAYTVGCLMDSFELRDGGRELWLDIAVHSTFGTIDRAAVLQQEQIRKNVEVKND